MANHINDIHDHESEEFPLCLHGPAKDTFDVDGARLVVAWIEKGILFF